MPEATWLLFLVASLVVLGLMLVAPPLAKFALSFSSPEYFALMVLAFVLSLSTSGWLADLQILSPHRESESIDDLSGDAGISEHGQVCSLDRKG